MFTSTIHQSILVFISTIITSYVQCNPNRKPGDNPIDDLTYRDTLVTDEEIFCWSRNSDRFVYSASLESAGCQINCTFWASSSPLYWKFYNSVDIVQYNKSDNSPCGGDGKNLCQSGVCIDRDDLPGQAFLTIISGFFPDQDFFSATDAYISVYVKTSDNSASYVDLGSTRVIEDDNTPEFYTTFTSPVSKKTGHFQLVASDRDSSPDDYICSFIIKFNSCKGICELSNGRYEISYKLEWISQSLQPLT